MASCESLLSPGSPAFLPEKARASFRDGLLKPAAAASRVAFRRYPYLPLPSSPWRLSNSPPCRNCRRTWLLSVTTTPLEQCCVGEEKEPPPGPSSLPLEEELADLACLCNQLLASASVAEKLRCISAHPRVRHFFANPSPTNKLDPAILSAINSLGDYDIFLFMCLVAAGQEHVLEAPPSWLQRVVGEREEEGGGERKQGNFLQNAAPHPGSAVVNGNGSLHRDASIPPQEGERGERKQGDSLENAAFRRSSANGNGSLCTDSSIPREGEGEGEERRKQGVFSQNAAFRRSLANGNGSLHIPRGGEEKQDNFLQKAAFRRGSANGNESLHVPREGGERKQDDFLQNAAFHRSSANGNGSLCRNPSTPHEEEEETEESEEGDFSQNAAARRSPANRNNGSVHWDAPIPQEGGGERKGERGGERKEGNFFQNATFHCSSANGNGSLHKDNLLNNGSSRGTHLPNPCERSLSSGGVRGDVAIVTRLETLAKTLRQMDTFYSSIGGILGYQVAALELMVASEEHLPQFEKQNGSTCITNLGNKKFCVPKGPDLSHDKAFSSKAIGWGLEGLPAMGEIYPLGGSGDRLGLVDDSTGESLPVAMLPYCGRSLLEGLIRDVQAREYLFYRVFGQQMITPIAIMTSAAKKNNENVRKLCTSRQWFGRGQDNFFLFEQPLVPTVAAGSGDWLISEPLTPVLKPGGHGVIWKLAHDKGVFRWFELKGRKAAIVRQISNPMAATDDTIIALSGIGLKQNKKFGFASCERNVGTAEGVNVLIESDTGNGWEYGVTCIEYTEFSKLGIIDVPVSPGSMRAQYPANTNILYVDLASIEEIASRKNSASLPGKILNLKKPVVFKDYLGATHSIRAGRIECTMQNAADFLLNKYPSRLSSIPYESLDTFVIYNQRRKVTSSAKRRRKPNDFSLHQTPEGSFMDLMRNGHELLASCGVKMPEVESNQCYIESGPPFIVLLHPALGPIWDVVRQKITGGLVSKGSELQLEIAEFLWKDVELNGSLIILAENAMGSYVKSENGESIMQYGKGCGRCRLERLQILNKGIDWSCKKNVYWQHKVERIESLRIVLHGNAEFEALDVKLEGSYTFEVPDGFRMIIKQTCSGVSNELVPLSSKVKAEGTWQWKYSMQQDSGEVELTLSESPEIHSILVT